MDEQAFRAARQAEGYETLATVTWEPGRVNDTHSHPFTASALVLAGEITVESDGETCRCQAGDTFELGAGIAHREIIGPAGVTFLVGRR